MSLINQLQLLGSEYITNQLQLCYGRDFPIEVRIILADFLERRLVNVSVNQLLVDEVAKMFIKDLLIEIDRKAAELQDSDPTRFRLLETRRDIRSDSNVSRRYRHLINCMVFEQKLLHQATHVADNASQQVMQSVYGLDDLVRRNESMKAVLISQCRAYQERYRRACQDYYNSVDSADELVGVLYSITMDELSIDLNKLIADCNVFAQNISSVTNIAQNLVRTVTDDFLKQWQWKSKFNGVHVVVNGATLDDIQVWCERLAMCLWTTKEQVRVMLEMVNVDQPNLQQFFHTFVNFDQQLTPILLKLVHDSFIVEHQPSQVIHKNSKFTAGVRLLIGKSLGQYFANPEVKVELLTESQARSMHQFVVHPTNRIEHNVANLEFSETENKMTAAFRHMRLDNFKRFGRKQTDSVTDEKSALCFHATINVGELSISIKKLSLPVVIIVSTSQETQALATIFWDNSFALMNRNPFEVTDEVKWSQLAEALNRETTAYCGRGLSEQNLRFLSEKLLRSQPTNGNQLVSWSLFCKQNLPNQNFTFWHWFHSALELTQTHLSPWVDGSIVGFISRQETNRLLAESPEGTFLLRFSETYAGKVSIATNLKSPFSNRTSVFHLQPFQQEFDTRPLFKILSDLEPLKFLYPNIPKAAAFAKYKIGYVCQRSNESPEYIRMSAQYALVWERSGERLQFATRGI